MDNFWIFIIIIGAVISLSQKSEKKAPTESDDTPQPNPQQEWERRVREILEEHRTSMPTPPSSTQPRPASSTSTPKPTTRPNVKPQAKMQSMRPRVEASRRAASNVSRPAHSSKNIQTNRGESLFAINNNDKIPNNLETNNKVKVTNTKQENDFSIDRVLDDFSMEKAVIYAEILKPKHEEY